MDLLVCPIQVFPHEQGNWYTLRDRKGLDLSLRILNNCLRVLWGLNMVLMFSLIISLEMQCHEYRSNRELKGVVERVWRVWAWDVGLVEFFC